MKKIKIETEFDVYNTISELAISVQNLIKKATEAREKAYAPYSQFLVGAALELENGEIILGNNQEMPLTPLVCVQNELLFITQELNSQIKKYLEWLSWQDLLKIQQLNPSPLVVPVDKHCQSMKSNKTPKWSCILWGLQDR